MSSCIPLSRASLLYTSIRLGVAAVAACFISAPVLSLPVNPTVVNGAASFDQAGKILTVTNTPGAIINWQKFSIGAGETTHFAQTSASSTVLNRVLADPTAIYGTLSSNGRVWLVNPAGIMVGPGGRVDVAGFVASTLNIRNQDFLAGRSVFINDGSAKDVINQGEIRTPAGGSVYLIGSNVTNEGIITTPKGETILAAGATVSLIDSATPGVKVDITGSEGNATNLGTITAEAGRIGIAGVIVRNSGQINASSVVSEGGRVFLKASRDTHVEGNGQITATGTRGGQVEVLGQRVAVTGKAGIDASGTGVADAGAGRIMVGGDYQGKNPDIKNASITWLGPDATLKADAGKVGDGGTVIVWADDTTRAYGGISARGGVNGGKGGFIETSAHSLDVSGLRVRADAPNGAAGQWLLDPINVTVASTADAGGSLAGGIWTPSATGSTITNTTIQSALSAGTSVTITTSGGLAEAGNITVSAPIAQSGATSATLTLQADNDINVNAAIGTAGARFNHDLSMNAGNRIGINSAIYLSNTMLSATAPAIDINAVMDVGTGTVRLSSTGTVTQSTTLPATITAGVLELLGVGGVHTLTHAGNQVGEVRMNTGSVVLTNNGTTLVNGFPAPGAGHESILAAATPVPGEQLGASIAVNGDVMVVGAPGAFMSGQGAAYVYRWNGTAWVFEARLAIPGTTNFGASVAVAGTHIVVGAPETFNGASRVGAAYAFEWNGSTWTGGTALSFTGPSFESNFGWSMAIDSGRLVVGGAKNAGDVAWSGRLWFYDLVGGAWVERGSVANPAPLFNDYFGLTLDVFGDRMIVGASIRNGQPGEARIFEFNPGTRLWSETQLLTLGVGGDFFGSNVSISGDLATVSKTPNGSAGSVYVYRHNGTNWAQEQIITPTDVVAGDQFGSAVRVRDGVIVATSARADLPGQADVGAGYVFKYNGSQWLQDAKITATTPVASDLFGFSAALANQRMVFGAYGADPGGVSSAGAAYAYDPLVSSTLAGSLTIASAGALTQAVPVSAGGVVSYKSGSDIVINAALNAATGFNVMLRADSNGSCLYNAAVCAAVVFGGGGSVATSGGGRTDLYYNPGSYAGPTDYSSHVAGAQTAWMLVNDVGAESGGTRGLQAMVTNLGGNYALGRDVDASATSAWNASAGFVPIGNNTANFVGKFDGLGHVITGLRVNRPTESGMGLFGYVGTAAISNVGQVGGSVAGEYFVGGLVGANNSGSVSNSYATGSVSGYSYVGGLVGGNYYGSVTNNYAAGSVSAINNTAGGLVGENYYGTVSNSYAVGSVAGNTYIGGLVGANNYGTVSNSYSTGMVTGNSGFGGLVGTSSGTVDNSFWDTQTSSQSASGGGTGLTTAQMQTAATFTGAGWSATVWNIADGAYPTLNNMPAAPPPPPPPVPCVGYDNCWTGAVNSLWATAGNWSAGHAPTGTETVKMDVEGTPTILITGINPGFGSLWLAENLDVDASVSFVLGNLFTLNAGAATFNGTASVHSYAQTGGTLAGSGAFTVTNNFAQTGGSINRVGNMTINQASGALNFTATRVGNLELYANAINLGSISAEGYIWAEADGDLAVNGPLSTATSSVHLFAGQAGPGMMTLAGNITAYTNTEFVNEGGSIGHTGGEIWAQSGYVEFNNNHPTTPAGSYISLGSVKGTGPLHGDYHDEITVASRGQILDNNGSATNITADIHKITNLISVEGSPDSSALAISLDIAASNQLTATVSGNNGGISLRNTSATTPAAIALNDGTANQPAVAYYQDSDLALGAGHVFSAGSGVIAIGSGGSLSGIETARFGGTPTQIALSSGRDLSLSNPLITPSVDISLSATSGVLDIGHELTGARLTLSGTTLNVAALVTATGDLAADAGAMNIIGGSLTTRDGDLKLQVAGNLDIGNASNDGMIYAGYGQLPSPPYYPDAIMSIGGNLVLTNGASITAANDVYLKLLGSGSTVEMTSGLLGPSFILSDAGTGVVATTYLTFVTRNSGGILLDGTATTSSLPGGSGFFAVNHSTPATTTPGGGLVITYANTVTVDPCVTSPDICKPPLPLDNPVIDVVEADPCATAPDSAQCKAKKPDDEGEEKDKFGDEETGGYKKSAQKTIGQCM